MMAADAKRHSLLRKAFWGMLGLILILGGLGFYIIEETSSIRLPDDLKSPPINLDDKNTTTATRSFSSLPSPPIIPVSGRFENIEDYAKAMLARNPRYEAAALYLEIHKRWTDEKISEGLAAHFERDDDRTFWRKTPYTATQREWLRGRAGFLELVHRLCRLGALPLPTREQRQENFKRHGDPLPVVNFSVLQGCARLLRIEAMQRCAEGDFAGARASLLDAFALAATLSEDNVLISHLVMIALARIAMEPVAAWAGNPAFPPAELAPLAAELERIEPRLLPPEFPVRMMAAECLNSRFEITTAIESGTWRSPVFGWGAANYLGESDPYRTYVTLPGMKESLLVPNLARIVPDATRAIYYRSQAVEALREYDAFSSRSLALLRRPYAQSRDAVAELLDDRQYRYFFTRMRMVSVNELNVRFLGDVARLHQIRAGLGLRIDTAQMLARREARADSPHDPWLDPFSGRPLKVDDPANPTLLYSIGPGLQDMRGATEYDPSNGTVSAGNIVLHLSQ